MRTAGHHLPIAAIATAPAEFAQNAPRLQTVTIDLSNARQQERLKITGTFIWAVKASQSGSNLTIQFNEQAGQGIEFSEGLSIGGQPFGQLFLTNTPQAGQSLTLVYGVETIGGLRVTNPGEIVQTFQLQKATTWDAEQVVTVGIAAVQLAAAQADRREIIINSPVANAQKVYIGKANTVTAANGIELLGSGTLVLSVTGAVWAIADLAGASVRIAEIRD